MTTQKTFKFSEIDGINVKKEEWKPVVGYEKYYMVSNYGRVKSLDRKTIHKNGSVHFYKGIILATRACPYPSVSISWDGNAKNAWVHNLVCKAFLGDKPTGMWVNHKDGNKNNNFVGNLEYISPGDNVRHAFRNGLMVTGSKKKNSKLNEYKANEIRKMAVEGITRKNIAERYGVSRRLVLSVINGEAWRTAK